MQRITTTALVAAFLLTQAPLAMAEEPLTQGIEVHGHWKIEILDPDGTSVSVHEFENALVAGGGQIAGLLSRSDTQGFWAINLFTSTGDEPCQDTGGGSPCQIAEPADSAPGSSWRSKNLTLSTSGPQFVLSGSVTATGQGANPTIDSVGTQAQGCAPSTAPDSCMMSVAQGGLAFSATTISPVAVQLGQIIQVTVTFTIN